LKRVRSVVRISRRSSEPFVEMAVEGKTHSVNHTTPAYSKEHIPNLGQAKLNSMSKPNDIDWEGFTLYLSNLKQRPHCIQNKIGYAKRYCHILETHNAQDLLKVSNGCRVHTMRSLSSLSKFLGCYDTWMSIVKKYQLRWKNGDYNSLNTFKNIFGLEDNNKHSLPNMINWIKATVKEMPKEYANILIFNTLTGLRPDEAYKAIHFIKNNEREYLDRERMLLLHYKYPDVFFRVTKKCYITVVNEDILQTVKDIPKHESYYNLLRRMFERLQRSMNMYYCRKVFATFLRNSGIEPEIIDLLQGRISSSVFVNHYYRPDINDMIASKIRPALDSLSKAIESVE
jgi:hypothetical protein